MTSYSSTSRNTTDFDEVVAPGTRAYLLTDALDRILVGEDEDEELILWDSTIFSAGTRNTTSFNSVARN